MCRTLKIYNSRHSVSSPRSNIFLNDWKHKSSGLCKHIWKKYFCVHSWFRLFFVFLFTIKILSILMHKAQNYVTNLFLFPSIFFSAEPKGLISSFFIDAMFTHSKRQFLIQKINQKMLQYIKSNRKSII